MLRIVIRFPHTFSLKYVCDNAIRIQGLICKTGEELRVSGRDEFELADLTPERAGEFVKDFYNEGFTETLFILS